VIRPPLLPMELPRKLVRPRLKLVRLRRRPRVPRTRQRRRRRRRRRKRRNEQQKNDKAFEEIINCLKKLFR